MEEIFEIRSCLEILVNDINNLSVYVVQVIKNYKL